jgi:hypothetical protein
MTGDLAHPERAPAPRGQAAANYIPAAAVSQPLTHTAESEEAPATSQDRSVGTDRETITGAPLQCCGERPYQGDLPVPISIGDARASDRIVASL